MPAFKPWFISVNEGRRRGTGPFPDWFGLYGGDSLGPGLEENTGQV